MTSTLTPTTAGDALRAQARECNTRAVESFERCDTDGFLSQHANQVMARKYALEADVADAGGMWEFPALFDLDGNMVAAKLVRTRFGMTWGMLSDPTDTHSSFKGWVSPSQADKAATRRRNLAKKGYTEGTVRAAATVYLSDGITPHAYVARTDGGFDANAEIVGTDTDTVDY